MAHRIAAWLCLTLVTASCMVLSGGPADAATAQRVWTRVPDTVSRGAGDRVVVTVRPIRRGREVRIRYRRVGGTWSRLGSARVRSSGNAVIPFTIARSGSYQLQATVVAYRSLPRIRGSVKALKVLPTNTPVVVAHRGGALEAPENTMSAFERALTRGAQRLEADVQETADGTLVLFHDRSLARTTDVETVFPGRENDPLTSFTFAELETLDAGSYLSPAWAGERIPTLRALLDLARDRGVDVLIEAKLPDESPGIEQHMLDEVRASGLDSSRLDHRVVYESFELESLQRFVALDPDANVSPILTSLPADLTALEWAGSITLKASATTADGVAAAHRHGLEVNVWTPDTALEIAALADTGVDALITDDPALAAGVLH